MKCVFSVLSAWLHIHKRQSVPCLSAVSTSVFLVCVCLDYPLMISTAVIINSLIWCQHCLVHSPDASTHSWSNDHAHTQTQTQSRWIDIHNLHTHTHSHSAGLADLHPSVFTRELISLPALLFSQTYFTKLPQRTIAIYKCAFQAFQEEECMF